MLRVYLRQLCRRTMFQVGGASSECMTTSSHHSGEKEREGGEGTYLEDAVAPFVPLTFTALTQISRSVDADLMEKVAEAGGLRSFLVRHPKLFRVSKVGDVYVACRLRRPGAMSTPSDGVVDYADRSNKSRGQQQRQRQQLRKEVNPIEKRFPRPRDVPAEVFRWFPVFFVPVETLLEKIGETLLAKTTLTNSTGETKPAPGVPQDTTPEAFLHMLIEKHREFIDVVSLNSTNCEGKLEGRKFVRLLPEYAKRAESYFDPEKELPGDSEESISDVLEPYRVEEYEHYRVARLFPTVEKYIPISSEMLQEACSLLPEGRSLIHVLVSAPDLFEVRDVPELSGRFILDSRFRPDTSTRTKEEIEKELDELKASRIKNGIRVPIDRKKRRLLTRELMFYVNPTPYLDERVWAHALFDVLPVDGPVPISHVMSRLSQAAAGCTPINLRRIFSEYTHLFRTIPGDRDVLLQRADIPLPEQRPVSTINTEEVLLSLYNAFPRRRHPELGSCLERCMFSLPTPIRHRLKQLDLVEDVLKKYPEKVEVLDTFDEDLMKRNFAPNHPLYRFRLFRFVGEFQTDLITRYEALCVKLGFDPKTTKKLE